MLGETAKVLQDKDITMEVSKEAKEFILNQGTDLKYGARPLRRAIQRYVEDEISDLILKGELKNGHNISINYDTELHFNVD